MCERCVATSKMTPAAAEAQRQEMADVISAITGGNSLEGIARMAVAQMGAEFVSALGEYGYKLSVGVLDTGNFAVGIVKSDEIDGPGDGYVLAEFNRENVRKMLGL